MSNTQVRSIAVLKAELTKKQPEHGRNGATNERPQILLPGRGRPESKFAAELGEKLAKLGACFRYNDRVVYVKKEEFSGELDQFKLAQGGLKFHTLAAAEAKTWFEQYVEPGDDVEIKGSSRLFVPRTMSKALAETLLVSPQFLKPLPQVVRILDLPIPIRTKHDDIRIPEAGFNKELGLYVNPHAPSLVERPVEEAVKIIEKAHAGFCWKIDDSEDQQLPQAKVHAIARLFTPFARGLIGFRERVPLFLYDANRPRAGKDYLAGVTQIVYLGHPFEDAAIGRNPEETLKRITAALRSGRRQMHFANCQYYLDDPYLIQAITGQTFGIRALGSNEGSADLELPNEIEYSLSANAITYRQDVQPRTRKIALAYFEENENERTFSNPVLHQWLKENRALVLSAVYSIFRHWMKAGCPMGRTPFTSFPRWAEIVGGVMQAAGLGDPCLPHHDEDLIGGDQRESAMKALFGACYEARPEEWIKKADIYDIIRQQSENLPSLEWFGFGEDKDRNAAKKTGHALCSYHNRILRGIRLLMDTST